MKKIKWLICLSISILCVTLLSTVARADFGDSNDYGGGSDWGSSDWGSSDYDYDYDYDYDRDTYDYSGGSSIETPAWVDFIIIGVIIFLAVYWIKWTRSKPADPKYTQSAPAKNTDNTADIINKIKAVDPDFSYDDFTSFVKRSFMDMQESWSRRDITELQTVLHPNLYEQTQRQVEIKIRDGVINKLERIGVNSLYLTDYTVDSQMETIILILNAQMVDYQIDEKTGNIIAGDRSKLWQLQYRIKLVRSAGIKTLAPEQRATQSMDCPNCGAHLPAAFFGKCEYCGSIVTSGKYGWVISEISSTKH